MLLIASDFASCVRPLGGGCLSIKGPFYMALWSFAYLLWLFCFFQAVTFCISSGGFAFGLVFVSFDIPFASQSFRVLCVSFCGCFVSL